MIHFLAPEGLPVDETGDGGDSAMRAGILTVFDGWKVPLEKYEKDGWTCRCPVDYPWDNVLNQSRDQQVPLVAGLAVAGEIEACRRIFWAHARRLFFSQNFQRDYPGSWKYPWPHKIKVGDQKDIGKWRVFDFADPMLPDHVWHLIKCAKLWPLYWFSVLGVPWFIVSMALHGRSKHREHNQILCMAVIQGPWAIKLFKKLTPSWEMDLVNYWGSRSEIEYADLIAKGLNKYWRNA